MKLPILCLAALVAAPALAQPLNGPALAIASPDYIANQTFIYTIGNSHYTPTMRRQELAQAIALRDEAAALLAADGGTLSAKNRRYIRNKANRILGYER